MKKKTFALSSFQRGILISAGVLFSLTLFIPTFVVYLVESYYSKGLYPLVAKVLGTASDQFNFSLSELTAVFFALYLLGVFLYGWREHRKKDGFQVKKILVKVATPFCLLYLLFYLLWGFNYFRETLVDKLQLNPYSISTKEIYERALTLGREVNGLHKRHRNIDLDEINDEIELRLNQVIYQLEGVRIDSAKKVKNLQCNFILNQLGVDGLILPFFSEAHINSEGRHFELPFNIAHEKAHLKGYALEDEASLIGYLACIRSKNTFIQYSGKISMLHYLLHSLPLKKQREVWKTLKRCPRKDLLLLQTEFACNPTAMDQFNSGLYDYFLKMNGVQSGMGSYEQVVPLFIAYGKRP